MNGEKVYDIDQEKLWLRIIETRRRRRVLIGWGICGVVALGMLAFGMNSLGDNDSSELSMSIDSVMDCLFDEGHRDEKSNSTLILDTIIQEIGLKAEVNSVLKIARESDFTTVKLLRNAVHGSARKENPNSVGQIEEVVSVKNRDFSFIEMPQLAYPDIKEKVYFELSNFIKLPKISFHKIDTLKNDSQERNFKKRFGLELFYGRGLSQYRSNTILSKQEAYFPIGYSWEYGFLFSYYANRNFYISFGAFESHPQYTLKINNGRSRAYPFSANFTLKVGRQKMFNKPFYSSLGLIYQLNPNEGQAMIGSWPRTNFPRLGSNTTFIDDRISYGLTGEFGYSLRMLNHNLSMSLNYNAFFRLKVYGEIRNFTDLDRYQVVGNYFANGNTLSLRFSYEYRF